MRGVNDAVEIVASGHLWGRSALFGQRATDAWDIGAQAVSLEP
jgi:hypothetical protein